MRTSLIVVAVIIVVAVLLFWLGQRYVAQTATRSVVQAVQNGFSEQRIYNLSDQINCSDRFLWKDCVMTSWLVLAGSNIDRPTVIRRMMSAGFTAERQFSSDEVFSKKMVNGVEGIADFSASKYTSQVIIYDVKTLPSPNSNDANAIGVKVYDPKVYDEVGRQKYGDVYLVRVQTNYKSLF